MIAYERRPADAAHTKEVAMFELPASARRRAICAMFKRQREVTATDDYKRSMSDELPHLSGGAFLDYCEISPLHSRHALRPRLPRAIASISARHRRHAHIGDGLLSRIDVRGFIGAGAASRTSRR